MKFKAKLEEPRAFLAVLQICRSIQRDCIVRLHETRMRFFTNVDLLDGVQVWMGCRTSYLFSDFRCASHYKEQSITCEVLGLSQLMHVLKQADIRQHSSSGASQAVMRLAQSGNKPILKLTMQAATQYMPDLSYDVPVRILSDREIESMPAPPLEDDHVQVVIPNLFELTTFVEKLKSSACDCVVFSAQGYSTLAGNSNHNINNSSSGQKRNRSSGSLDGPHLATLEIYAENYLASFSLKYDAVEMIPKPREESDEEEEGKHGGEERHVDDKDDEDDSTRSATVAVEVKKFARFFSAVKEINPTRLSMYIVDQRALVLSVQATGNTTMVAYIPAKKE